MGELLVLMAAAAWAFGGCKEGWAGSSTGGRAWRGTGSSYNGAIWGLLLACCCLSRVFSLNNICFGRRSE